MDRPRLTITLKKELLNQIDGLIDGVKIRNRSHAIESLLAQVLAPKIKKAVILAGGEGVKMRPLTYEIAKPMIPIQGRPLMEYTIDLLKGAEINEIMVALSVKDKMIERHFGDGRHFGVKIIYAHEKTPLGTAGPLRKIKRYLSQNPFLVIHGDILADIDLKAMVKFHHRHRGLATMTLTSVMGSTEYGIAQLDGYQVTRFSEPPDNHSRSKAHLTNAGIYIFEPKIFSLIPKKGRASLEDIFPVLIKSGDLYGYAFSGQWFDITTPTEYERAIKEWGN